MKKVISLTLFLSLTFRVMADCAGSGMFFYPSSPVIKQNSIFVIEGYAGSQKSIVELNKKYPVYLKSGESKVKLTVLEIHTGQYYLTQAILAPEEKLTAGKEYQLYIDDLSLDNLLQKWNSTTGKYEDVSWKVEEGLDMEKPVWTAKPNIEKKTYTPYGCGPAEYIHFIFDINDASPVLIKTTVTHLKTEVKTTYCLESKDLKTILIGHGMCSGAFTFTGGGSFEITFELIDFSGNRTPWIDEPISFTAPDAKNSEY